MKNISIMCLLVALGLTISCDYSSYRKDKEAEKGKTENMAQEETKAENMAPEESKENNSVDTSK